MKSLCTHVFGNDTFCARCRRAWWNCCMLKANWLKQNNITTLVSRTWLCPRCDGNKRLQTMSCNCNCWWQWNLAADLAQSAFDAAVISYLNVWNLHVEAECRTDSQISNPWCSQCSPPLLNPPQLQHRHSQTSYSLTKSSQKAFKSTKILGIWFFLSFFTNCLISCPIVASKTTTHPHPKCKQTEDQLTCETGEVFLQVWCFHFISQDVSLVEEEDDGGVEEPLGVNGGVEQSQTLLHAVLGRTQSIITEAGRKQSFKERK